MALTCVSGPLMEPVQIDELKSMLRMDAGDTSQDGVLTDLGVAARAWCETICQRRFVQQKWRLLVDFFPGYIDLKLAGQRVSSPFVSGSSAVLVGIRYAIVLPYPPAQAINTFIYQDANGGTADMMRGSNDPSAWGFIADLQSQPARLTPPFSQMWPVARVVVNAVQVEWTLGYATPVAVTTTAGSGVLGGATFQSLNIGQPVSLPGAGPYGGTLSTVIKSVSGGVATVRDLPAADSATTALLVNYGIAAHWELIRLGIKFLVSTWFINRVPSYDAKTRDAITSILGPARDERK